MSDATTGTAQAKARVSTMPKLSMPTDGATRSFARSSSSVRRVLAEEAEHVDPVLRHAVAREQEAYGERVGADDAEARARARVDRGPGTEQDGQTLARIVTADEDDVLAVAGVRLRAGSARRSGSRRTRREPARRRMRACSETAIL